MINSSLIEVICEAQIPSQIGFQYMGLVNSAIPKTLSYLADEVYLQEANANENITGLIVGSELGKQVQDKYCIIVDDPLYRFWSLFNAIVKESYLKSPTIIASSAKVHPKAWISDYNVKIGENTIIEPNVIIHPDTIVGDNCLVRSGTVCGFDGFEQKRTSHGIISVMHDGKVIVEDDVEIGSLNSIAKGMMGSDTIIGRGTKTDSMVHIAHGVTIGQESLITACAEISGSVTIGDRCWLGPNCSIINGIQIGNDAIVGIGAVVIKNVEKQTIVAGNPAKIIRGV